MGSPAESAAVRSRKVSVSEQPILIGNWKWSITHMILLYWWALACRIINSRVGVWKRFFEKFPIFNRPSLFCQVPVFDRIRLAWKFRHRPFRIFSNFEKKIFTELGDTAPQSWQHFGKPRKIQDPSTAFSWKSSKKCSDEGSPLNSL